MDLRWDRAQSIRPPPDQKTPPPPPRQPPLHEQTETWDSNSSDDTSVGDYDGADMMMMPQPDVDIDEELAYEFPREDLAVLLEGLNKWPWTVYPIHLRNCLTSAAKLASLNIEDASSELRRLQTLYREAVPSAFEKCLDDKAIWKWNDEIHTNIFDALCRLMDLVVAKLPQLLQEDSLAMDDILPLLRSLALGLDKQSQYHLKHKEYSKPPGSTISGSVIGLGMGSSTKFAKPLPASPTTKKSGDWYCSSRKASVRDADGCECSQCRPTDTQYSRLSHLLNYFGQTVYGNGYHQLLKILGVPHKLVPALLEAVLLIVSRAAEFLLDDVAEAYIEPCNKVLKHISDKLDSDVDALSDKTRDGSFAALSSILKHLQIVIARGTSSEHSETVVSVVQRKLVERMLSFHSFNKHLSAVREINKLLENARAISSSDSPDAVGTTIEWLERMGILHKVLKSHLHHKQYVDQVQKIMKFLLEEKQLSEDHLDAIWAATEKPDQFETVKANIFDLIADLAWSFSPDQLDSLFERLERSQGQSASDIVRILSFMKKLARSDNKGVMASRLLELLWKMTMADDVPGEIMESGAFSEILGHYDSINCASKDVYISRCLLNLKEDKAVILSLRLLRDFIWLDSEKPFYQNDISRRMHLQQLIKDHDLFNMVVSSLEKCSLKASAVGFSGTDNTRSSYEEQVKERLDFLLFILQSSGVSLSWETSERLWNCMIESPASGSDKESGFSWFEALDKWTFLSLDAQVNILTKKMIKLDPSSLSLSAWRCFLRLFLWVNQSKEKLKPTEPDDAPITHDLDLVGLPYLWQIAFSSPVEPIVDQSINILREIYTCLSDSLQEDLVGIRQRFIDKCIGFLEKTLEVCVLKCTEKSDCSSSASGSMVEEFSENVAKSDEKDLCNSTSPLEIKIARSYPFLTDSASVPVYEFRQVENCLRILRTFIIRCEGRCPRSIPPHTASFQGRPFILGVMTANKQSTRFDVTVHTNEYLSTLRAKVAKFIDHPVSRVRLTYLNRDLVQDSQVLWQCGLIGGQTISASVNMVERITRTADENHLPGILISKNTLFYDTLFKLMNVSDTNVREAANNLLLLLPTHPAILEDFYNLHEKNLEDSRSLLKSHFADQSRLLYSLQVLDGLVMPVNRPVDAQTLKFRKSFLEAGGIQHLLAILQPGALPENVDDQTRRGCYASCLRILKFLLSEKMASEEIVLPEINDIKRRDASSKIKVDSDIASEDIQITNIVETQVDLDVIDMSSIICALRRITWVAAIGRLSEMGKSFPVNAIVGKQTRKSAKKRSFPDDVESGLDPEDQYLCFEALEFLMLCLSRHKYLWRSFFTSSETDSFIVAMILHSPDKSVRYRAAINLMKLCSVRHGVDRIAYKQVLTALLAAKAEAAQHPKRCQHYWELLAHLFYSSEGAEEHDIAAQQLEDELQWLNSAPGAVDDDDRLLEGHLHLVKVLVDLLNKRIVGVEKNQHGRDLIQLLIKDFLFPDSAILLHDENSMHAGKMQEVQFGVFGASPEEDGLLQAKCSTRGSREKAFQLLLCLATHCKESFREIVELILKIHLSEQVLDWEHLPSYGRKAIGGYVGLKNAGATCYMNSVFQQLFMQPEVRRSVLACTECDDIEKAGSVFFQLQAMFGALLGSSLDHYTPQGFWCAYRDYDGMPINLREHQDAFEFFNRLYDAIDETLKATHQETTLTRIFGGVFAQQVICRGCPHRSEREEPFAAISVDVKNKKDLLESLEAFVRGDLLEGDNAYYCDECGIKVDALKRVCVKSLPHTLVIHLKRFDFDYETMQRLKLKDRFEFPMHIDMKPYTVEGLTLREMQNPSPRTSNDKHLNMGLKVDNVSELFKPDMYYHYDLVGVVVHSGTAFAGHYYSYIKQRPGDHPLSCDHGQTGGWIAFDDKNVEPYDVAELEKDCFGGKYMVDVYDNFLKTTSPQELDRPNSAYMLFYERSQCEVSSVCSPSEKESSFPKDDNGDAPMKEISLCERLPSLKNIQMPASVHRSVWQENLRFIHENNLMDKDYFRFLFRLAEVNYDLIEANASRSSHKAEVGEDHRVEGVKDSSDSECPFSLTSDGNAGEFSKISITLSIEFLLRVYLRMHANFREDLPLWKSLMCRMFEKSMISCQSFMFTLVEQRHWVQEYLIRCPVEEIQQVFACLLVQALRCSVSHLNGNSFYVDANGRSIDAFHIDAVIDVLFSFLRDPVLPKYACHQYFQVILEYANFGVAQRFHLLQKSALSQLVNTTVNFVTRVNFQMAKLDFACLHSIVSILLRNCDTSQFQSANVTADCEAEGHVDNSKPLSLPNPLQLPPPLFPLSKEAGDAVFKQHVYISVLLETCPEHEEAVKLLEFCCWNNESYTMWALQDLLDSLHRAVNNEVKPLLAVMLRILLLEDSLQKMRQKVLLLGPENSRSGVMALIVTRVMNSQKRYLLLKFLVKLVNMCPATRTHLLGRRGDWKCVVDWLQDEIHSHGISPGNLSTSISNEDLSNGHLQRTNSAEWTLLNARNLLGT